MKRKLIVIPLAALMLISSCGSEKKEINTELLLKDNSGIRSQLKTGESVNYIKQDDSSKKSDTLNYNEQRAVWISYIDLKDMLYNKSAKDFEKCFDAACKNCLSLGSNTLYVHVRAFGDSYYKSGRFRFTKTAGVNCDYDPLDIMVKTAHNNGLSFHAWINPLRCETPEYIGDDENYPISRWASESDDRIKLVETDGHYWLDPSYDDVRRLICDGIAEIIDGYEVDGIHFDDYFYPTTDESFDEKAFSASGSDDLAEWRTDNINKLVAEVYKTVKSKNKDVLFGISPQGNIDNNINKLYADVYKWCSEDGYIDYIVPQIYFGFENPVLPFETAAAEWSGLKTNENVSLIIGIAAYKIYTDDEYIENSEILASQIELSQSLDNYSGYALYNYISLFPEDKNDAVTAGIQIDNIEKKQTVPK